MSDIHNRVQLSLDNNTPIPIILVSAFNKRVDELTFQTCAYTIGLNKCHIVRQDDLTGALNASKSSESNVPSLADKVLDVSSKVVTVTGGCAIL